MEGRSCKTLLCVTYFSVREQYDCLAIAAQVCLLQVAKSAKCSSKFNLAVVRERTEF